MTRPILLLGFEPFGSHTVNPAQRIVEAYATQTFEWPVECRIAPVATRPLSEHLDHWLETLQPSAVLALGLAPTSTIRIERVAVNLADFRIPDAEGQQPIDQKIESLGPDAYFSTLPTRGLQRELNLQGIPSTLSETAGTYVCNWLLYQLLHRAQTTKSSFIAGFIHIPHLPEMIASSLRTSSAVASLPPSMCFPTQMRAIQIALRYIHGYLMSQ